MRVLFLTHSYPRFAGDPPGSFLLALACALRHEGVDVHVVAPAARGLSTSDVIDGIPVTRFHYAPRKYETLAYTGTMAEDVARRWSARFAMLGFLGTEFIAAVRTRRAFHPDLIHAHWWFPGGLVGTWVSAFARLPLVTTMHGTDLRILRSAPRLTSLASRVLKQSAAVTTVSSWLAGDVGQTVPPSTPLVAPMPVATALFTPDGRRDPNRLVFVGRLNAQKGIEYAIRAVAAMRHDATLDVVGIGPALEDSRALARTLGVANRIIFHGQVAQHELPPFYRQAAAVVVPSIDEGLGLVAVEAQLCETPVVAFASGGLTDVVQHQRTGLLVPPRDVVALASALDTLLDAPIGAAELGRAGRLHALAKFTPASVAQRYAGIYRDVLQLHAG